MNRYHAVVLALIAIIAIMLFSTLAHAAQAPVFDAPSISCAENGPCSLVINKSAVAKSYSKVRVRTVDDTAKAGTDYRAVDTTLTIGNNTLHVTVPIPLIDNTTYQGDRRLFLRFDTIRNAQFSASMSTPTIVTITDNEFAPTLPPPSPTPDPSTGGVTGATTIPDNFDTAPMLEPTWYGPTGRGGIASVSADTVGAFRFFCGPGQLLYDDPIALPGQPRKSHLHQFIGNTAANASSTYQSLRTTGGSTCDNRSLPAALNRSAYWMPAMLDGMGNAVRPDYALVYYKRIPKSSPACGAPDATHIGYCTDMPNGLRFIFGYNMATMTGGPMQNPSWDRDGETFDCETRMGGGAQAVPGIFHNIAEVVAAKCPVNAWLKISLSPPTCWDGKNLDVADHRSHVVYADGPFVTSAGERACPPSNPYYLPNLAYQWYFTTNIAFTQGKWRLSCDDMTGGLPPGSCLHMDYFEGWSPTVKAAFHAHCIDEHLTCNNGDLGNGTQMKEASVPSPSFPIPPLVPLSSIP